MIRYLLLLPSALCASAQTCSICLEETGANDMLTTLPCHHGFHAACISQWRERTCPNCRGSRFRVPANLTKAQLKYLVKRETLGESVDAIVNSLVHFGFSLETIETQFEIFCASAEAAEYRAAVVAERDAARTARRAAMERLATEAEAELRGVSAGASSTIRPTDPRQLMTSFLAAPDASIFASANDGSRN